METLDKVRRIVADQMEMDTADVRAEQAIQRDLGADSLDVTEIAMAVEEEFRIAIDDSELESLVTVADVTRAVERKLGVTAAVS